jgi:hypothetical protein
MIIYPNEQIAQITKMEGPFINSHGQKIKNTIR